MLIHRFVLIALIAAPSSTSAQGPVLLREVTTAGKSYKVETRTEISGALNLPAEKGKSAQSLKLTGRAAVDYDERLLSALADGSARSIRYYRAAEFRRTIGDRTQETGIRPAARRMVVLRLGTREVPFSPDGPLTFGEIDQVRTDVYTPALSGLLPGQSVNINDRWPAVLSAVEELTDMERIEQGGLECQLTSVSGRVAQVRFSGTVRGVNEDGPTQQQFDGNLTFDLDAAMITGLTLTGIKSLLDGQGQAVGRIEGKFTIVRRPIPIAAELTDAALRGLALEPNQTNTWLVYEGSGAGVRFEYPRRWRVSAEHGRQITLDDVQGNGLLITVEPAEKVPTPASYQRENQDAIVKQKGKVLRLEPPERLTGTTAEVSRFGMDVEIDRKPLRMEYFIVRQSGGGATMAATLSPNVAGGLRPDLEQLAKNLTVGANAPVGVKPLIGK